MKLHKLINIVMDKIFKKYFAWFKGQYTKSNQDLTIDMLCT